MELPTLLAGDAGDRWECFLPQEPPLLGPRTGGGEAGSTRSAIRRGAHADTVAPTVTSATSLAPSVVGGVDVIARASMRVPCVNAIRSCRLTELVASVMGRGFHHDNTVVRIVRGEASLGNAVIFVDIITAACLGRSKGGSTRVTTTIYERPVNL